MSPELTQKLRAKYPALFANPCDFTVRDGWFVLIDAMCEAMSDSITHLRPPLTHRGYGPLSDKIIAAP